MATLAVAVLLPGWFLLEAKHRIEDKRRALLTELPPLLAADEAEALALLASPLFDPPSGEDAGPVLNAPLAWDGLAHAPMVPEQCVRAVRRAGAEWQHLTRGEVAGCEVGWLHDLRKFGRWTLHSGRQRVPARRTDASFPEFLAVQDLAKLHLLLAVDHEQAAQDVRHLARLLFTHEYLLSAMIGVALLRIEEKAWESSGRSWSAPPLTKRDREFLREHLFTAIFAVNPLAPARLSNAAIEAVPRFRRCLMVTEQAFMGSRSELPSPGQCSFEHARWELAHHFEQTPGLEGLSWPARLGALLVERVAPAYFAALAEQLSSADGLPSQGHWPGRKSEVLERLSGT